MIDRTQIEFLCLEYLIKYIELMEIQRQKHEAVKQEQFEQARKLKSDEVKAIRELPTLESLREIRIQLSELKHKG